MTLTYLHPEAERVGALASRLDYLVPRWEEIVEVEALEERGPLMQVVDALAAEEHADWQEVFLLGWSSFPEAWDEGAAWSHWNAAWRAEVAWRLRTPEDNAERFVRSWFEREALEGSRPTTNGRD